MNSESLLSHAENLVPGFVTLAVIAGRIPADMELVPNPTILSMLQQPIVGVFVLTAIAYLLGALVFILSRWIVDTVSALTMRPFLLKMYRWSDFPDMNPIAINRRYRMAIDDVLSKSREDAIRQEVTKRRQRGRLIRTLIIPLLLWPWPRLTATGALIVFIGVVAVYSYSELSIYQEARLA